MTFPRNRLITAAALLLGGLITGQALAASDPAKESGIGGTGAPAMRGGIGGTGSPAMNGGIGGTGLQPDDPSAPQALAGKVLFIVGKVEAQKPGQVRTLAKGDPVRVGDILKSGKGATVQLRMEDGGTIVLRPESRLAIESFAYKGVQDGSERMSLALLSGGFRAVTGEIGHLHKENYSIRTPNARVGILGTDHETVYVPTAGTGQTAMVEPGTYNHVYSGATVLQSENSKLLIKPSRTGFAALNGTNPIILDRPLLIFGDPRLNPSGSHAGGLSDSSSADNSVSSRNSTGSSASGSNATGSDAPSGGSTGNNLAGGNSTSNSIGNDASTRGTAGGGSSTGGNTTESNATISSTGSNSTSGDSSGNNSGHSNAGVSSTGSIPNQGNNLGIVNINTSHKKALDFGSGGLQSVGGLPNGNIIHGK